MGQQQDVPDGEEGEHLWLGGQMKAAQKHGVEVQMCMALAHQIVMSVEWPSVTNCRVNGDGGLAVDALVLPSVLAGAVGLGEFVLLRVWVEIMGPVKYENVGKSQSVLNMTDPIMCTRMCLSERAVSRAALTTSCFIGRMVQRQFANGRSMLRRWSLPERDSQMAVSHPLAAGFSY
jgi:hypothetical protein